MKKLILALTIIMIAAGLASADTFYLRDGRVLHGTLLGFINGRFVVRVDTRNSTREATPVNTTASPNRVGEGEIQYFRPNEIEKIEIEGRSLDDMRFETKTVQVPLEPDWVDTGVDLRRNERVQIRASGTITAGRSRITPDGVQRKDPTAPLPQANEGLLIGAIGDDARAPILELGSSREFVADRDGHLYLTLNRGTYNDARGSFAVEVRRERDLSAIGAGDNQPGNQPRRRRPRQSNDQPTQRTPQELTINVPGTSRGTDAGIDVHTGDQITFEASGTVVAGRRLGEVGPEGAPSSGGFGSIIGTRPLATAGPGALIGYIRNANSQLSNAFLIGRQSTFTVPADGRLILAINDDNYADNGGSFSVKIRY